MIKEIAARSFRGCLFALLAVFSVSVWAQTPNEVIQRTTDQLLADMAANKVRYKQDPQAFYNSLNRILGPVVDTDGISRSIMTVKYSRTATPAQMARFEENFKRSLMQFYGNALLEYTNQQIRVLPQTGRQDPNRMSVNMEIVDRQGTVYPVTYTMVKLDDWRVRNVIINGINIGKLFRDQFAESMQRNRNDLDKTIDGWADVVARAKSGNPELDALGQ